MQILADIVAGLEAAPGKAEEQALLFNGASPHSYQLGALESIIKDAVKQLRALIVLVEAVRK
jgi:hypothetical protein